MSQSTTQDAVFIGVHLAADRVNAVAVTEQGETLAESSAPYLHKNVPPPQKGFFEENAEIWWDSARLALGHLVTQLRSKVANPSSLKAIAISGDPGDLLIVDHRGTPACPAILRRDARADDYVKSLNYHGQEHCKKLGIQFHAADPLAKIVWIKDNQPELYENICFVHQADFIIGRLKGLPDVTEYSFSTRTGCDLIDECWPDWLDYDMHLGVRERLPRLVRFGEKVGTVSAKAASSTGLPVGMAVIMGATSETASFLASGARKVGDFHTILSRHITISGISPKMIKSTQDQIHVNKLPDKTWCFSVESKTGAEWISSWFTDSSFDELVVEAEKLLPTTYLAYPNVTKGETFPFVSSSAEGFISPATDNRTVQFSSCLQGTAMFEWFCYQKLDRLAEIGDIPGDIYSGGAWSASDLWMQCRADVTGRVNRRMTGRGEAAFGTAMMAALGSQFHSIEEVSEAMISTEATFFPNPELHSQYAELFANFCSLMEEQGYVA
jgi:xylulokinase